MFAFQRVCHPVLDFPLLQTSERTINFDMLYRDLNALADDKHPETSSIN